MQHLSNLSILLIAALAVSTIALPLTSDEKSVSSQADVSKGQDQIQKINERQGRVYNAFGDASASRRGRFNRDVESSVSSISNEKLTTKTEAEKEVEKPKSNERQGRVYNAFGDASASRRGRFNRDLSEKTPSTSSATQEKPTKVQSEIPEKSISSSTTQLKPEQNEREGRAHNAFGDATASRRGRFNRDVESSVRSSEKLTGADKTETEEVAEKPKSKSSGRQARSWSPFGKASPAGRGMFN